MARPTAHLSVTAPRNRPVACVLVLHGGMTESHARVSPCNPAHLRMLPFVRRLARAGQEQLVVARLRNAVRGWNGAQESPVADARWALAQLTDRFGDLPIGLVGHSLGGRTALHVAGHPQVASVVALAPWLTATEPEEQLAGRGVLLVHGRSDGITSAAATAAYTKRLQRRGVDARFVELERTDHAMLRRAPTWHRLATDHTVQRLLCGDVSSGPGPS